MDELKTLLGQVKESLDAVIKNGQETPEEKERREEEEALLAADDDGMIDIDIADPKELQELIDKAVKND